MLRKSWTYRLSRWLGPALCALTLGAHTMHGQTAQPAARPELKLAAARFARSQHEISGGAIHGGQVYIVADKTQDRWIYRLGGSGKRFTVDPYLDLSKLGGYTDYLAKLSRFERLAVRERGFDLEGLAVCGDDFYFINEGPRHVLRIIAGQKLELLPEISTDPQGGYPELYDGGANAGFEGIAVDCAGRRLYLAKERAPRRILVVDLDSGKLIEHFDIPPSDRTDQRVINPFNGGQGLFDVKGDFADLTFEQGHLYALERNTFEVTKIEPKSKAIVGRVSYFESERGLYETGEPFGIAEVLILTPETIMVGLDNNRTPLSRLAQDRHGVSGRGSTMLYFKRPPGF